MLVQEAEQRCEEELQDLRAQLAAARATAAQADKNIAALERQRRTADDTLRQQQEAADAAASRLLAQLTAASGTESSTRQHVPDAGSCRSGSLQCNEV